MSEIPSSVAQNGSFAVLKSGKIQDPTSIASIVMISTFGMFNAQIAVIFGLLIIVATTTPEIYADLLVNKILKTRFNRSVFPSE